MYTVKIKFDWVSEDENYHYLELWGRRMGNVIYAKETSGRFSGYCCPTHCKSHFGTVEEAKEWVVDEVRKYFEANNFEFTETPPKHLHEIRCNRCESLVDVEGCHCPECGEDLCAECAKHWTEMATGKVAGHSICRRCLIKRLYGDVTCERCRQNANIGEGGGDCGDCGDILCKRCAQWSETDGSTICKRCRDKFAQKAELIEDDSPCDRCGKHANVGNGGGVCAECEDILCGTCGWWSDEDNSSLCITCRRKTTETSEDCIKAETMTFTEARKKMEQGETILRLNEPQLFYRIDEMRACVVNREESARFHLDDVDATDWVTFEQYQTFWRNKQC